MCWRRRARAALCAITTLVWGLGGSLSCGGGGGGGGGGIITIPFAFPQGFFPISITAAGPSDAAFAPGGGDLLFVTGTGDIFRVAIADGALTTFATGVGGGALLRSIVVAGDGAVFVGAANGDVLQVDAMGVSMPFANTGANPVTGLAIGPAESPFEGNVLAAAGASGIQVIDRNSPGTPMVLTTAADYIDLTFSGVTLVALDTTNDEVDTIATDGTDTVLQAGLNDPVGITLDAAAQQLLVAEAGNDRLSFVPVTGGGPTPLAPYDFDPMGTGIAYDGLGTIAFVSADPPGAAATLQGINVPPLSPATFGGTFGGPTAGFGDLELLRDGNFVAVANDPDDPMDPTDSFNNFLFTVNRFAEIQLVQTGIAGAQELLLSLTSDPVTQQLFIGTASGTIIERNGLGGLSLFATDPAGGQILGLERAPATFGAFGGQLFATTDRGDILRIDPANPMPVVFANVMTPAAQPAPLSDLVFSSDGRLFVLDNGDEITPTPRVFEFDAAGMATDLGLNPASLGQPDGLGIDEGGNRLLVATVVTAQAQLLAVNLTTPPTVSALNLLVSLDEGFLPTGVVYDRIGGAVVRIGSDTAGFALVQVFP
ncbi:MAG: hypothetical protein AAF430_04175 [Myxococcota bacterium]